MGQGNSQVSLLDKWIYGHKEKGSEHARVSMPVSLILLSSFLPIPFLPRNPLTFTLKFSFQGKTRVHQPTHTAALFVSYMFHSKFMSCPSGDKPGSCEIGQGKTIYQALISPRRADRAEFLPLQSRRSGLEPQWPQLCLHTWHGCPEPGLEGRPGRGCLLLHPCARSTETHEVLCL